MTKDDYILRSLAKVSNKKWEFYVISRIIHKLDDPEIEFVTQQLVRREDGKRALTDLFFPQFGLHLEVDESQHLEDRNAEADRKRAEDIQLITGHRIERISVAQRVSNTKVKDLSLSIVSPKIEDFISLIRSMKLQMVAKGEFEPWNFDLKYDPSRHINNGIISKRNDVVFRYQRDALRCFGYEGGHFQRGAWRVPDGSNDLVWFPRLYETSKWKNELSSDGLTIFERAINLDSQDGRKVALEKNIATERNRIVFAKAKSPLGYQLYRYVGTFRLNAKESSGTEVRYDQVSDTEKTRVSIK